MKRFSIRIRELNDLDAASNSRHARADEAKTRLRQTV